MSVEPGTIKNGEILVVVGENGCGKSTFLDILAGKLSATDGGKFNLLYALKVWLLESLDGCMDGRMDGETELL